MPSNYKNLVTAFEDRSWTGAVFVLFAFVLIFFSNFSLGLIQNETDVIPSMLQIASHDWLPNDWYLNLDIGYRALFNRSFGWLVDLFGVFNGAYVIRVCLYFLFAYSVYFLARSIQLNLPFALLALACFLYGQSIVAGEWMVGAVETKTIAYSSILIAFAWFVRQNYLWAMLFLGLAFSFHVLVGLYGVFCIGLALILSDGLMKPLVAGLKNSWAFLIAGVGGILFCLDHLSADVGSALKESTAWTFYVSYRVPHHALPTEWHLSWRALMVIPFTCLALFAVLKKDSRILRLLGWHYLACLVLVAIGLSVYASGNIAAMRYYFFRYSDVMLLFMGYILTLSQLQFWLQSNELSGWPDVIKRLKSMWGSAVPFLALCASLLIALVYAWQFFCSTQAIISARQSEAYLARQEMASWIDNNTPKGEVFIVNPAYKEFYIEANRPVFVTFKHVPQTASNVAEWVDRLSFLSGDYFGKVNYFQAQRNYREQYPLLEESSVTTIASKYDVSYFVTRTQKEYSFEKLFSNSEFAVYRL